MKFKSALGVALFAFLGLISTVQAAENTLALASSQLGPAEYGRALPPVGFVNFCARNPVDCQQVGVSSARPSLSSERWKLVSMVNSTVNRMIAPVSDQELYGQAEFWAYPKDAGDCEDYVLQKKRDLESLGIPAAALLITVVRDENNEGHAVLTLTTAQGDFILDNRRDDLLTWKDVEYKFLKRQSPEDPRQWVSLQKDKTPSTSVAVSTQQ